MSAQRQEPIDFAAEGLRLALPVDRNCGIQAEGIALVPRPAYLLHPLETNGLPLIKNRHGLCFHFPA